MQPRHVSATVLGIAQDGGRPQAGCARQCCVDIHSDFSLHRSPVSLGLVGSDHSTHLFEATRKLASQFETWFDNDPEAGPLDTLWITHAHLGHVDGLGLFGREVMGASGLKLHCSNSFLQLMQATPAWNNLIQQGVFIPQVFSDKSIKPTIQSGFTITPIRVPHRDELSDTHAFLISGPSKRLLFLPDHDSWQETLTLHGCESIEEWFSKLSVDIALIDGTFWSLDEIPNRAAEEIPHPTVEETLQRLADKKIHDVRIIFFHLNHTNPLHRSNSKEYQKVIEAGWEVAHEGMTLQL
jgi:pyrroloquinoline quinone biosynthesis protein B